MPNLIENQIDSFEWLKQFGIAEAFKTFGSVKDSSGKRFELSFTDFELGDTKLTAQEAKRNKLTLEVPLKARVLLKNKHLGTEIEEEIFMTNLPIMTKNGSFIINGNERVVVPQLSRSYGVTFIVNKRNKDKKLDLIGAKVIPASGAWVEIYVAKKNNRDYGFYVSIDNKREFPITALLRVLMHNKNNNAEIKDEEILEGFKQNKNAFKLIKNTLKIDPAKTVEQSYMEIYSYLRDGDLATPANAKEIVDSVFNPEIYDISESGRFFFNKRFGLPLDDKTIHESRLITVEDFVLIINRIVELNDNREKPDDIDHLGFKRVHFVGELLKKKVQVGLAQMKKNIRNRMSTIDIEANKPTQFVSPRPLQARVKEFFNQGQLSQYMSQENILAEIEHLRTLVSDSKNNNGSKPPIEQRDVHESHYGRVCPVHTPEGPNIGLVLRLASYAKVNKYGMIETPYIKLDNGKITDKVVYMNALEEEKYKIAGLSVNYDEKTGKILDAKSEVRIAGEPHIVNSEEVEYIDVAANQPYSIATSCVPFLNHDDSVRALMGSNMQKQGTPCLRPEAPLVATGIEERAIEDSLRLVLAEEDGVVSAVDSNRIVIKNAKGIEKIYPLVSFERTNGFTCFHQRPKVDLGDKVKKGDLLADASTSDNKQMALGQNMLVAFMSWFGNNFEDAIVISEKVVKDNRFTSIHIEEFVISVRDTKLGPEVTTPDIPNVGEAKLKNLDEDGIVRVGAEVRPGDILVGKITPKGEVQLTPEERLLRSVFGEKARDVKDTSKRLDHGKRGRVISIKVLSRDNGDKLESGIIKKIYIEVAQLRNVQVGDKMAGRHGNKGVISKILPVEEMPFMADGTPIDIILTPLGVPSRMNLGQILEIHLGLAAGALNYQAITPPFMGATVPEVAEELKAAAQSKPIHTEDGINNFDLQKAGLDKDGKMTLFDGRTGEAFAQKIAVGIMYILKLHHMVEDKMHVRSTGPYSLITQQPLSGKAQGGGQRLGEMEVWALLGYGVAHLLREMLTVKSDDIQGRTAAFDAIVKNEPITEMNIPASFNVILAHFRALGISVNLNSNTQAIDEANNDNK